MEWFSGGISQTFRKVKGGKESTKRWCPLPTFGCQPTSFIRILPERRKNLERITRESVLNWGWKIIGDNSEVKDIYFVKVDM
jgi:hypothetical protein